MLGIVSVIYNKLPFVKKTIEAVLENTKEPYHYVLVYNDSPYPGVLDYVNSLPLNVLVIKNKENRGITRALAQGINCLIELGCDFYVKIDDDSIVLTKGWNEKMLHAFEVFPYLGVLSADIDSGKQTGHFEEHTKEDVTIQVFDRPSVGGALTIYPLEVFKKVGFFKDFGYYGQEDGEFAVRCRAAGYQSAYLKDVNCQHLGRTSESDPLLDKWKIETWYGKTKLEFREWKRR